MTLMEIEIEPNFVSNIKVLEPSTRRKIGRV